MAKIPGVYVPPTIQDKLKYEVAEELGLMPRVLEKGWASLTAGETGRVGGLVRARVKAMRDAGKLPRDTQPRG